jgi:hypothetical protein
MGNKRTKLVIKINGIFFFIFFFKKRIDIRERVAINLKDVDI